MERVRVLLAWVPLWGLWFLISISAPGQSLAGAALDATVAMGAAALLGAAVWRFTGVYVWPEHLQFRFYGVHLLAGSLFAILWMLPIIAVDALRRHVGLLEVARPSRVLASFAIGLWIYGLVTGVCYAVRTRGRLREQERLAAEARLAALRNQLNPHFLFNALHSLNVLVRTDPAAAQVAIEQLGELLRYTLAETEQDEVQLAEEWRFTKTYLDLEQVRFGARLAVKDQLDPDTLSYLVPSFTLQILAENAVRHGVGPLASGGVVRIRSAVRDGSLLLEVSDTGAGASEVSAQRGRGLRLLRERLTGLYGDAATLEIRTVIDRGFTATVMLPARRE
ncbi:MAG TPA: histidine kinase [Gemmatimonadales bacterium]|nr:histidine kinase [Gemmatimonadales bacterium]